MNDEIEIGHIHCPICTRALPHTHDKARWIGVDFDGTLAYESENRTDPYSLGEPIPDMVERVKGWLADGYWVKLFTARMCGYSYSTKQFRNVETMRGFLENWCQKHLGHSIECTNQKDGAMEVLWDDRAVSVLKDSGMEL